MEVKETNLASAPRNVSHSPPTPFSCFVPSQTMMVPENMNLESSAEGTETTAMVQTMETMSAPAGIGAGVPGILADSSGKKKRGRPRKYDADGNLSSAYLQRQRLQVSPQPGFPMSPAIPSKFSSKRGRGRPPGSGHSQILASFGDFFSNTTCTDFTPHVVSIHVGEDVAGKILSFAQKGQRGVCILSAIGTVSSVTIRQAGSPNGILTTYEGRFEILSLSGSFTVTDSGSTSSETGGLSVSLAGPDGRVIGGCIAGLLTAAGPIQIVVGSFTTNDRKAQKRKYTHREHNVTSPTKAASETVHAIPNGENTAQPSPQINDDYPSNDDGFTGPKQDVNISSNTIVWNDSNIIQEQRESPDINVSLNSEQSQISGKWNLTW